MPVLSLSQHEGANGVGSELSEGLRALLLQGHQYSDQICAFDWNESCVLLGYQAACSGDSLPTFRDNMWVRNYNYTLCNNPEERSSHVLQGGSVQSRKVPTYRKAATTLFSLSVPSLTSSVSGHTARPDWGAQSTCGSRVSRTHTLHTIPLLSRSERSNKQRH